MGMDWLSFKRSSDVHPSELLDFRGGMSLVCARNFPEAFERPIE